MPAYVIAFEPDEKLRKHIVGMKQRTKQLVGDQLYLKDDPHMTVYLGKFDDHKKWDADFEQHIKSTVKEHGIPTVTLNDWFVFKSDPVTGNHTLIHDVHEDDHNNLQQHQEAVVSFLQDWRSGGTIKRYEDAHKTMDDGPFKDSSKKFGYPFVGKIWRPHFGNSSIKPQHFDKLWKDVKDSAPEGTYQLPYLSVFSLNEENEDFQLLRRYDLREQ